MGDPRKGLREGNKTDQTWEVEGSTDREPFYIVGVGASAGGLEALERMFRHIPRDTGMAFVVVQHLSPDFKSLMDELLARQTQIPIHRVEDGMKVEPNSIYLIPPKKEMIVSGGRLLLTDKDPSQGLTLPIDRFFRSLAQDAGRHSIGIVLSGTGSDGSRGLLDIHEAGGLVVAQTTHSAKFDGMPKAACETGVVDISVSPEEIGGILTRYAQHPLRSQWKSSDEKPVDESSLDTIFRLLQQRHHVDFKYYKPTTIGRRIERRIQLSHIGSLEEYVQQLEDDATELDALYRDLLIGVTRFFRDRDAFATLETEILPQLLLKASELRELRIWVAGCATGEEAYAVAMLVHERLSTMNRPMAVKIFATDIHRASLDYASAGIYPEASLEEISPERRQRYFKPVSSGFQIDSEIRQMIVFAPHNLVKDAPFTRLHLITCRNLLIYLRPPAQKKVMSLFHFGLITPGILFLGSSETPGELSEEFETINERWKIYRKRRDVRLPTETRLSLPMLTKPPMIPGRTSIASPTVTADHDMLATYDALLSEYVPPAVLVNEQRDVLQMFGGAGKYLRFGDGRMTANLLDLAEGDLKLALTGALQRVAKDGQKVVFRRIHLATREGEETVNLTVSTLLRRGSSPKYLITFEPLPQPAEVSEPTESLDISQLSRDQIQDMETELRYTKESLQATVEELETSNEELQATNEELVASNEELQSTNEELHSVNEELYTVNAEYQKKIAELTELTNDMDNLLVSTAVHTVFLDEELRIRKFTPKMAEVFNLMPQDVGRRLDGFSHNIQGTNLKAKLDQVLQSGEMQEQRVTDSHGIDFLMRILPYRAMGSPGGVVLTLIDISSLTRAEERFRSAVEAAPNAMVMINRQGQITLVNSQAEQYFGYSRDELNGRRLSEFLAKDSRIILEQCCQEQMQQNGPRWLAEDQNLFGLRRDGSEFALEIGLRPLEMEQGRFLMISLVDVSERKQAVEALRQSEERFERAIIGTTDGIWDWPDVSRDDMWWSRSCYELLGYQPDEIVPRYSTWRQLMHPDDVDRLQRNTQPSCQLVAHRDFEFRLLHKSGQYRWYRHRALVDLGPDGRPIRMTGSTTDIDRRKRAELQAQEEIQRRDQFLAMLSHELRNPMGAVLNAADALHLADSVTDEIRDGIQIIQRQTQHMARLLDDLLDVSRITHNKIEFRSDVLDLVPLAESVVECVQHLIEQKDLQLTVQVDHPSLRVIGDPARLRQAQVNLLTNAAKYTPAGGRILYQLARTSGPSPTPSTPSDDDTASSQDQALIRVRDSGEGIPAEMLDRVFDWFVQSDSKIDRALGGMGVGLSLARTIVEAHGGMIVATSEGQDRGSEFTIQLPLTSREPTPVSRYAEHQFTGTRLLLVEDNEDARKMLVKALQHKGFKVSSAADGVSGLEVCQAIQPEVAVIDLGLPRMDGYQLAREIRKVPQLANTLLIALTGYGRDSDRQAAAAAGFDAHLIKPLNPQELYRVIARRVSGPGEVGHDSSR